MARLLRFFRRQGADVAGAYLAAGRPCRSADRGSVILAGVLLKMGGYGFCGSRSAPAEATQYFAPLIFGLSVVAVIYTSLVALVQEDMKKLIAYSSVAHMGVVTIGAFI